METIGQNRIWSFADDSEKAGNSTNRAIRQSDGHRVVSYWDLAKKIAELQFRNRDYVLLFRGQTADHRDECDQSTLKPKMFRPERGSGALPAGPELFERFANLRGAEAELARAYASEQMAGTERVERQRVVRWSILQHYEICPTPLLDVTHSLRIAASFASHGADGEAFIFVLGVPNLSGAVTASAEAGIQTVRLSSVCPPCAVRPHIQEGYLLGEYPEFTAYDQKQLYSHHEVDFGRRLLGKFRFDPTRFWDDPAFPIVRQDALYPDPAVDPLFRMLSQLPSNRDLALT